jgi:hypothetical protein
MDLAMDGHNVFVGGKPGTGKTYTVKRVVGVLKQTKQVTITCTTGMACSLYDDGMTLHNLVPRLIPLVEDPGWGWSCFSNVNKMRHG